MRLCKRALCGFIKLSAAAFHASQRNLIYQRSSLRDLSFPQKWQSKQMTTALIQILPWYPIGRCLNKYPELETLGYMWAWEYIGNFLFQWSSCTELRPLLFFSVQCFSPKVPMRCHFKQSTKLWNISGTQGKWYFLLNHQYRKAKMNTFCFLNRFSNTCKAVARFLVLSKCL